MSRTHSPTAATPEFNFEVQQRKHWKRRDLSNRGHFRFDAKPIMTGSWVLHRIGNARRQEVCAVLHLLVEFATPNHAPQRTAPCVTSPAPPAALPQLCSRAVSFMRARRAQPTAKRASSFPPPPPRGPGLQPQRTQQRAINPRRGREPVICAEAADCRPGAAARISIHRAGVIAVPLQCPLHPGNVRAAGIARIGPAMVGIVSRRRWWRHDQAQYATRSRARTPRPRTAGSARRRLCESHGCQCQCCKGRHDAGEAMRYFHTVESSRPARVAVCIRRTAKECR